MPRRNHTPKHEAFAFTSSCSNKKPYVSEKEAEFAIDRKLYEESITLYTYRCDTCKLWHLTRVSPSRA